MADQLNHDLQQKEVVFIGILNGVFMFASDLLKNIQTTSRVSFIKLHSYHDDSSSGSVTELIGLNDDLSNKTVVILEDIIDTGITLEKILAILQKLNPLEIKIVSFLFKPEAYRKNFNIDYIGMKIPDRFVVGYGMDYKGYGRNLKDIYSMVKQ